MFKVGIIGATGYVGVELLRLLLNHDDVIVTAISSSTRAVIEATRAAEPGMEDYKGKSPLELTKKELADYVKKLEKEMKQAAGDLQFERAAQLRDQIFEYKVRL